MVKNKQNSHGLRLASQKNGGIIDPAQPGSPNLTAAKDVQRIISLSPNAGRDYNIELINQYKSSNSMGMDKKLVSLAVGVKNDDPLIGKDCKHAHTQPLERGDIVNSRDVDNVIDKTGEAAHRKTNDPDFSLIQTFRDYLSDCMTSRGPKRPMVSEPMMEDGEECTYFVDSDGKVLSESVAIKVSEILTKARAKQKQVSPVFMKAVNTTVRGLGIYARK